MMRNEADRADQLSASISRSHQSQCAVRNYLSLSGIKPVLELKRIRREVRAAFTRYGLSNLFLRVTKPRVGWPQVTNQRRNKLNEDSLIAPVRNYLSLGHAGDLVDRSSLVTSSGENRGNMSHLAVRPTTDNSGLGVSPTTNISGRCAVRNYLSLSGIKPIFGCRRRARVKA